MNESQQPTDKDAVLGVNNPPPLQAAVLGGKFKNLVRLFYTGTYAERIDILIDAFELGSAGIPLIAEGLKDCHREVRQAASLMLAESADIKAHSALNSYLPFSKRQCLDTISKFPYPDSENFIEAVPDLLQIADYNNSGVIYWDLTYRGSEIQNWDLATGTLKLSSSIGAHEFSLGDRDRRGVYNYQDLIFAIDINSHESVLNERHFYYGNVVGIPSYVVASPSKRLVVLATSYGYASLFEVWDYENLACLFQHKHRPL